MYNVEGGTTNVKCKGINSGTLPDVVSLNKLQQS